MVSPLGLWNQDPASAFILQSPDDALHDGNAAVLAHGPESLTDTGATDVKPVRLRVPVDPRHRSRRLLGDNDAIATRVLRTIERHVRRADERVDRVDA